MKILYGVDTAATGSAARYVVPTDVTDWTRWSGTSWCHRAHARHCRRRFGHHAYNLLDDTGSLDDFGPVNDTAAAGYSTPPYASATTRVLPCVLLTICIAFNTHNAAPLRMTLVFWCC